MFLRAAVAAVVVRASGTRVGPAFAEKVEQDGQVGRGAGDGARGEPSRKEGKGADQEQDAEGNARQEAEAEAAFPVDGADAPHAKDTLPRAEQAEQDA